MALFILPTRHCSSGSKLGSANNPTEPRPKWLKLASGGGERISDGNGAGMSQMEGDVTTMVDPLVVGSVMERFGNKSSVNGFV